MAKVVAVCISERKGERKRVVDTIELREEFGVVGDAHGGSGRQVSLLALEAVESVRPRYPAIKPGDFAENITTQGLVLEELPLGTRLAVGEDVLLEVTQIGKRCHDKCAIHKTVGYCVMPKQGIFARVLSGGVIRADDQLSIRPGIS